VRKLKQVNPSITPKNCLNNDMIASKSFAVPETRLLFVISSKALVIASPGTKIMMAATMVSPILSCGENSLSRLNTIAVKPTIC
jgi:hypothetical protein